MHSSLRQTIGYAAFFIAIGMLLNCFISSNILDVIIIIILLVLGYCCICC